MSHLIRIYTVCHSGFDFRLKLFAVVDMSKMEESDSETQDERVKNDCPP